MVTYLEKLQELAVSNSCTEEDCVIVEEVARRIGFPKARVLCGIAYLEGKGTMEFPPMSVNQLSGMLVKVVQKAIDQHKN